MVMEEWPGSAFLLGQNIGQYIDVPACLARGSMASSADAVHEPAHFGRVHTSPRRTSRQPRLALLARDNPRSYESVGMLSPTPFEYTPSYRSDAPARRGRSS